jgi:hypothetical protein
MHTAVCIFEHVPIEDLVSTTSTADDLARGQAALARRREPDDGDSGEHRGGPVLAAARRVRLAAGGEAVIQRVQTPLIVFCVDNTGRSRIMRGGV